MILAIIQRIENVENEKPFNNRYYLTEHYKNIFDKLNVLLFPIISEKNIERVCDICEGLIITGTANDIHPQYYNEEPISTKNYEIDEFQLDRKVIETFYNAGKPVLGICGGIQSINVYFGGTLNQNIDNHNLKNELHNIKIKENSFLYKTYHTGNIDVNSFHHQSIKKVADGFDVTALANDGTIEAIENENIIGVQWHPEQMEDFKFFENFIKIIEENKKYGK